MPDHISFEELYELYHPTLFKIAINIVKTPMDAEDVVQEAFTRYLEAHDIKYCKSWLRKVTHHVAVDVVRGRVALQNKSEQYQERVDLGMLERKATDQEMIELIDKIDQLSEKQRRVIQLHYFEGKKFRTISKMLSIPIGTALRRADLARKHLNSSYQK